MNVFKLKPGSDEKILISQENFEKYTGKEFPYCVDHGFNRKSYYAVCPACDNPIQFVGLYQKTSDVKGKKDAYGRHHKGDIPKLAKYDEIAYLNCPLSNRNYKQDTSFLLHHSCNLRILFFYNSDTDMVMYRHLRCRTQGILS